MRDAARIVLFGALALGNIDLLRYAYENGGLRDYQQFGVLANVLAFVVLLVVAVRRAIDAAAERKVSRARK